MMNARTVSGLLTPIGISEVNHWNLIKAAAERTMPIGPMVDTEHARRAVRELEQLALDAAAHVAELTGLDAGVALPAVVVDRAAWVESNAIGMQQIINVVTKKDSLLDSISDRAGAIQMGLALGWASGRVLGQFEAFTQPGRLLLVAPNIVKTEKAMAVDERDFRMWVCLHEETHRVQFNAVSWLQQYFLDLISQFVTAERLAPAELSVRIAQVVYAVVRQSDTSILELVQSEEQKRIYNKISALMTLLEGHADYIMDLGGPALIPSVHEIRSGFEVKRDQNKGFISHLLGMNEKLLQYRHGAAFVRAVVDEVSMQEFNRVWHSPQTLPTMNEIHNPRLWRSRVLGAP